MIARRQFLHRTAAGAAALLTGTLHGQGRHARIKIDTERVVGEVHPHLFGNFTEHLGRCIYGGIFEEGSPLSDSNGYRTDVTEATKRLGVSVIRWPGGNFVSGYHWKDGIGPRNQRPPRRDHAWGLMESNRFGTDEFLKYCEVLGVEPYLCINAGLGTIDEARDWVEYCNEPGDTALTRMRKANGREKPWNVKIWGLGNEIDGPWQLGHKNAEAYATFALEAAKAMRRADESIQLIASGSSNFGPRADWIGWNRTVLERLKTEIDFISLHTYIGNRDNNFEKFLSAGADIDDRIDVVEGLIKAARIGQNNPRPIAIAFDEWNVWYRTLVQGEFEIGRTGLEEKYNYEDALAMGMFLNSFIRHAHIVKMANLAQLVNVIAPMFTNKNGMFLQTIYWPLLEYGKQRRNTSLDVLISSPTYASGGHTLKYLDVSATYEPGGKTLFLNVLNRSEHSDIQTRIENAGGAVSGDVGVWELNHPDLKATHNFGDDKKVLPATRTVKAAVSGGAFSYTFPKHSLTILSVKLA